MKDTDPNVNSKKSNSDEELVQVGEQVPLNGKNGDEEAVEKEDEGGDGECWEEREKTSDNSTNIHSFENRREIEGLRMIAVGWLLGPEAGTKIL